MINEFKIINPELIEQDVENPKEYEPYYLNYIEFTVETEKGQDWFIEMLEEGNKINTENSYVKFYETEKLKNLFDGDAVEIEVIIDRIHAELNKIISSNLYSLREK
jgi:hypothetical protein